MHVVLTARREDRLNAIAEEIDRLHGAKSLVIAGDLANQDFPKQLFDDVKAADIDVALLVNNAGFGQVTASEQGDLSRDLAAIDVNIRALTELTYRFLEPLREATPAAIVNVASVVGFLPVAYMPVYSASKAFVLHFSESLWTELKNEGVHIAALCPGTTETEFFDNAGASGWLKKNASQTPAKVVRTALKGLDKRRPRVVSGWRNRVISALPRFFPRSLVVLETRKYFRPKPAAESDTNTP